MTVGHDANLFHGVDRALFVSAFVAKLRGAGLAVPLGSSERVAQSLEVAGALGVQDLYWLLKVSLTQRREDFDVFDEVFSAVFDFELNRTGHRQKRNPQAQPVAIQDDDRLMSIPSTDRDGDTEDASVPWVTRPSLQDASADDDDGGDEGELVPELLPSELDHLSDVPFDLLDEEQLARIGAELELASRQWPMRRSRRSARSHRGRPDLRRTLRASLRSGGEALVLAARRPRHRPRRVVLLIDVSGSMERHVRPYLHVTRALTVAGRAEVFAFATDLTRLTPALRCRSTTEAMTQATEQVGDRFGGTKMATSLGSLLAHRVWGPMVRGSIVVVISDGWDTDHPDQMDARMRRLGRLAHRVIWVNPRVAAPGFEPLVGSMAAALPHCDAFLPGNSVRAMGDVLDALVD